MLSCHALQPQCIIWGDETQGSKLACDCMVDDLVERTAFRVQLQAVALSLNVLLSQGVIWGFNNNNNNNNNNNSNNNNNNDDDDNNEFAFQLMMS